ncbi:MAG: winged helix-turn-helix transcriptional regulator [Nitrosarchaeum sp.]|nr:winged helix-turn-helix transcriptional regulator [Nitrosarchaeum sp.]
MPVLILNGLSKVDDDSNVNASEVLHFIQENPGCHLRHVKRELKLAMGTIQYHLNLLEKQGKIFSEKQMFHRRYFPVGLFEQNEREILNLLNQETPREIIMFILEKKNPSQSEISKRVNISPSSVNWHIKRMEKTGLIISEHGGKFTKYRLSIPPQMVTSLLKHYHPDLWNRLSDRLADLFFSMSGDEPSDS